MAERCPNGNDEEIQTTCGKLKEAAEKYDSVVLRASTLDDRIDVLVEEALKLRTERDTERARAGFLAAELAARPAPVQDKIPWWLPDLALVSGGAMVGAGGVLATDDGATPIASGLIASGLVLGLGGMVLDWFRSD